jgi:hypothetical protein
MEQAGAGWPFCASVSEQALNGIFVLPARAEPRAAAQFHFKGAAQHGVDRQDAGQIDDPASMHSQESHGVEPVLDIGEAVSEQILFLTAMQLHIVVGRLDPVNRLHWYQIKSLTIFHHDTFRPFPGARIKQHLKLFSKNILLLSSYTLASPLHAIAQPLIVKRFQKVIHGIQFERLHLLNCAKRLWPGLPMPSEQSGIL